MCWCKKSLQASSSQNLLGAILLCTVEGAELPELPQDILNFKYLPRRGMETVLQPWNPMHSAYVPLYLVRKVVNIAELNLVTSVNSH